MTININAMKELLEDAVFSPAIAGEILAIMRPAMKSAGIRAFPVIALTGEPGVGKTAIMEAVLSEKENLLDFHDKKCEIIEILRDEPWSFFIVDDVAELNSYSGKQGQRAILDQIVRWSYRGKLGTIGITIEREVLPSLSRSCRERLLEVDIGDGVNDPICAEKLTFLQRNNDYCLFLDEFRKFYHSVPVNIHDDLISYRKRMEGVHASDSRSIDLIFCYVEAMKCVQQFCSIKGYCNINMNAIDDIATGFYKRRRQVKSVCQGAFINVVLQELLHSDDLNVQFCEIGNECSYHIAVGCKHRSSLCDNRQCENDCYYAEQPSYTPTDMLLSYDLGYNALFIDEPEYIPHFHRPYKVPPFLIIDAADLTLKMNAHLKHYCVERKLSPTYWGAEKLRKDLFAVNRCLVIPNDGKGYRYTFDHLKIFEQEVSKFRAVAILLRDDEAEYFRGQRRHPIIERWARFSYSEDSGRLISLLRTVWPLFSCKCSEVGEYCPEC